MAVTDDEAIDAFARVARLEGIIPALETAHALHCALPAAGRRAGPRLPSGRGDKDIAEVWSAWTGARGMTAGAERIAAAFAGRGGARR